jgi:hypothetical protein
VQNFAGISDATLMGLDPLIGFLSSSVSLLGGHRTTITWAPTFAEQFGISDASEIGIACAGFTGVSLGATPTDGQHDRRRPEIRPSPQSLYPKSRSWDSTEMGQPTNFVG